MAFDKPKILESWFDGQHHWIKVFDGNNRIRTLGPYETETDAIDAAMMVATQIDITTIT
jgi:hypothetical protein